MPIAFTPALGVSDIYPISPASSLGSLDFDGFLDEDVGETDNANHEDNDDQPNQTDETDQADGMDTDDTDDIVHTKRVTKSEKAGLNFPVRRAYRKLRREARCKRIGETAPLYMAAAMEYLTKELLLLAGRKTKAAKRKRIIPHDIFRALVGDKEFHEFTKDVIIPRSGVMQIIRDSRAH